MNKIIKKSMLKEFNGKVDNNDLALIVGRHGMPVAGLPCPLGEGGKINPHVTKFLLKSGEFCSVFHIKPVYYEHLNGTWRPLSEVLEHHGNRLMILKPDWDKKMQPRYLQWLMKRAEIIKGQILLPVASPLYPSPIKLDFNKIHFLTLTQYPDSGSPGAVTIDGTCYHGAPSSFATNRAGGGDGTFETSTAETCSGSSSDSSGYMYRGLFNLDTSALTSGATISAATFSVYTNGTSTGTMQQQGLIQTSSASANDLVAGDYDAPTADGFTEGATRITPTDTAGTENIFTLNATGLTFISKTSITKLGIRFAGDLDNSAPGSNVQFAIRWADYADVTSDPKIVVTYTTAAGPANLKSYNTNLAANIKSINTNLIANVKSLDTNV